MTEEHPYTSRFHRLKTAFAGGHKLAIPESWVDGRTPNGNAWVGDGNGRYELQLVAGGTAVDGEGDDAMPEAIMRRVSKRLETFGASGQIGDSRVGLINDGVQIEVVADDPRIPTARTYNWIRLLPNGGEILEVGFHLIVLRELWDRPATQDLIDLFGAQIANVAVAEPETLGFDRLRTTTPFGFLSLQVPARWRDERDPESGEWFCGEDATDTGTLWIDYDSFAGQFDARGPERLVQKLGDAVAWRPPGEGWRRLGHQSFTEDAAVKLRFHRWFVIDWSATRAVMVTLTLCLQAAWDDEPEFQRLVAIIEQQAATLGIGPLPG